MTFRNYEVVYHAVDTPDVKFTTIVRSSSPDGVTTYAVPSIGNNLYVVDSVTPIA